MYSYFPSGLNVGGDFSRVTWKSFASGFNAFLSASNFFYLSDIKDVPTENSKVGTDSEPN